MAVYLIIFGAAVRPDGTPSDTLARRVEDAMLAGLAHADPIFMPSGGRGGSGHVEAEVMRDMLLAAGVPAGRIVIEDRARDTLESARLCDALLRGRGDVERVEPCTSRFHLPRCALLLRLLGWPVHLPRVPRAGGGLPATTLLRYVLKECVALPYDAVLLTVARAIGIR